MTTRRGVLAWMLPATAAILFVAAAPAERVLTREEFIDRLDHLTAQFGAGAIDAATVDAMRAAPGTTWVVTSGKKRFRVSTDALEEALGRIGGDDGARRDAIAILEEMRVAAGDKTPVPAAGADGARARLEGIMARPEFSSAREIGWVQRLRDRVRAFLGDLLEPMAGAFGSSAMLGEALAWGLVAVFLGLAVLWTFRAVARDGRPTSFRVEAAVSSPGSWRHWFGEAVAAARDGRYRDAVRCGYWAAIRKLGEEGVLPLDETCTHREFVRLLPVRHRARPAMKAATARFEAIWYGGRLATAEDFSRTIDDLQKLGCTVTWQQRTGRS
ncbi:MAG: DUF4129 domain-containing protein [Acidobacteriota bacterium]